MRELEVTVYDLKQQIKELNEKNIKLDGLVDERDEEIKRLKNIIYDAAALDLKP